MDCTVDYNIMKSFIKEREIDKKNSVLSKGSNI